MTRKVNLLTWNVRGLNKLEKRLAIRKTILLENPLIICLQETKLSVCEKQTFRQFCGYKLSQFLTIDANGTKGGILTAWNEKFITLRCAYSTNFALTTFFSFNSDGTTFKVTNVYGPSTGSSRSDFFNQLKTHSLSSSTPWILAGDFNIVLATTERNNNNADLSILRNFRQLLSTLELSDLPLQNRSYTWSNQRINPIMARLDRFLVNHHFLAAFPNLTQLAIVNTSSDHAPVKCTFTTHFKKGNVFRFENYLLTSTDYIDFFLNFWFSTPQAITPLLFSQKMEALARETTLWIISKNELKLSQITFIRNFLTHADETAEIRNLTRLERWVVTKLKRRFTELSFKEELYWRQRSSLAWNQKGDLNSFLPCKSF